MSFLNRLEKSGKNNWLILFKAIDPFTRKLLNDQYFDLGLPPNIRLGKSFGGLGALFDDKRLILGERQNNTSLSVGSKMDKGGIDLNPSNLDLQTKGDETQCNLPTDPAQLEKFDIPGLYPVILNMAPVGSLPLWLGLDPSEIDDCQDESVHNSGESKQKCREEVSWQRIRKINLLS